jgi:hypothetical protein
LQTQVSSLQKELAELRAKTATLERQLASIQDPQRIPAGRGVGFVRADDDRYVFTAHGATIEIDRAGRVTVTGAALNLESATNVTAKARASMTLESNAITTVKSRTTMTLESGADMNITASAPLRINNGTRPVAGLGDTVTGLCPPMGGALANGRIGPFPQGPAATVLVP